MTQQTTFIQGKRIGTKDGHSFVIGFSHPIVYHYVKHSVAKSWQLNSAIHFEGLFCFQNIFYIFLLFVDNYIIQNKMNFIHQDSLSFRKWCQKGQRISKPRHIGITLQLGSYRPLYHQEVLCYNNLGLSLKPYSKFMSKVLLHFYRISTRDIGTIIQYGL